MTTAAEPDGAPRLASLDILRGVAILGILFMNIQDMGGSMWANWSDVRHYGWSSADQVAWWLRMVFADGTARCLLEMLFGVGMVILTDRAANALGEAQVGGRGRRMLHRVFGPWPVMRGYYWRNIVLFAFGLVHIFILLWPGDILHTYGIAAMVAFLFRRLKPAWLLGLGLVLALLQLGGGGFYYVKSMNDIPRIEALAQRQAAGTPLSPAETKELKSYRDRKAKRAEGRKETAAKTVAEDKARTGTFMTWAGSAWATMLELESRGLEIAWIWEAAGTMLIGAALYKWGIIQGRRSRRFYIVMTLVCYAIGLTSRAIGAFDHMRFDDMPSIMWAMQELARLTTTAGHIGVIHLLLASVAGARLMRPFEAAGRTALTIYIAQTLICLWLLYPPFALGLYGTQGWMAMMLTSVAINLLLLWAANVYLRHYKIAPVEWAWRSIIAGRRLPIRHGTAADRARPLTA